MRLLTWNINALAGTVRNFELTHGSFRGFLDHHRIDILAVQEHKLSGDKVTREQACVDGYESFWAFSTKKLGYSGVATWCKLSYSARTAEVDCLGTDSDDFWGEGRVVCTDHGHFVLINVYVPNAGGRPARTRLATKLDFLRLLKAKADALEEQGREVIIVGDLNVAATQKDVHHQIQHAKCYSSDELAALFALTSKYTDVWRRLHPHTDNAFTVWDEYTSARISNEGCRIDFVLVTPGLLGNVVSCEHLYSTPPKWSDHAGVMLELRDLEETPPAKPCTLSSRRWKRFNDRSQPSIASIFARKRPAEGPADGGASPPAKAPASTTAERNGCADGDEAAASVAAAAAAHADGSTPAAVGSGEGGTDAGAAESAMGTGPAADPPTAGPAEEQHQNGVSAPAKRASSAVPAGRASAPAAVKGSKLAGNGGARGRKQAKAPAVMGKGSIQSFLASAPKHAE